MFEGGSFAVGEDGVCFLIFVVGAIGIYYLMVEYLFHLLSTYHSYLCWHLEEFENDLGILGSRFLFRMSFGFFCLMSLQIPHVMVSVYQYSAHPLIQMPLNSNFRYFKQISKSREFELRKSYILCRLIRTPII